MKVLVLTNMYPRPDRPWYGTFVREQVDDVRALGVDCRVLFCDGRSSRWAYLRGPVRLRRALSEDSYDLVHAHYGLTGAIAVTQRRVPVVTTFHGGDYSGEAPWQTAVSRLVAPRCTPIVVNRQGATRLGRADAAVIPCGVDTAVFGLGDRGAARRSLGWDGRPTALFLGRREVRNKRADLFDAAVDILRERRPDVATHELAGMTRAQVAEAMRAADVCVLTSDYEGSPVAVREALACGRPVVSVPVGDVETVLADLPGCAVVPRDPGALAAAMAAALELESSDALRARAEETSRPRIAARVVGVYERTLG